MSAEPNDVHEPEVISDESHALARPSVPTTINELASLDKERGVEIVQQRLQIFNTMRVASIQLTMPNDWTLFRSTDGGVERISGFLGDQGCDRIKKLWGIQVTNIGTMERIEDDKHPGEFAYRITGDGTCGLTGEAVFDMEGIRYSTEKYATEKPEGIQRVVAVQKAARANLDGGITRELAGMKSVPIEELDAAWNSAKDTWKKSSLCNKGRGFGSKDQRLGKGDEKSGGVDPQDIPLCDICNVKLTYRAGKKEDNSDAWFGCPTYQKHPNDKVTISLAKLKENIAKRPPTTRREPGDEG